MIRLVGGPPVARSPMVVRTSFHPGEVTDPGPAPGTRPASSTRPVASSIPRSPAPFPTAFVRHPGVRRAPPQRFEVQPTTRSWNQAHALARSTPTRGSHASADAPSPRHGSRDRRPPGAERVKHPIPGGGPRLGTDGDGRGRRRRCTGRNPLGGQLVTHLRILRFGARDQPAPPGPSPPESADYRGRALLPAGIGMVLGGGWAARHHSGARPFQRRHRAARCACHSTPPTRATAGPSTVDQPPPTLCPP